MQSQLGICLNFGVSFIETALQKRIYGKADEAEWLRNTELEGNENFHRR